MIFFPNELKEVIYDLSEINVKIILNKIFRWSFYIKNPLKNQFTILTEQRPIYVPIYSFFPFSTTYTPRYGYAMEAIETTLDELDSYLIEPKVSFQGNIDF